MRIITLLSLLGFLSFVASERVVYKNDFKWKFKLGDVANENLCPADVFPIDMKDMYCQDWAHQAAYQMTEAECRIYCCGEPTCAGYIFNNGWCAIGNSVTGCTRKTSSGYTGGARPVPAKVPQPPPNGPQSTTYDDSTWDDVDVPHDYIVLQTPSPDEEWSHGYRPKNISWYRKHFTLDDSFKDQIIWIEFDGVYRSSDMWLNGQFLGHHASGYTSFRYRLDNFPGVVIGGDNVLSVRIDPRGNEGWWYEGAGIYRHSWIVRTDLVHITPWGVYVPSQVIGTITSNSQGLFADSRVEIYTETSNVMTTAAKVYVLSQIVGPQPDTTIVWTGKSETFLLDTYEQATAYQNTIITNASLWDVSQPKLYTLVSVLIDATTGVHIDNTSTTFGIRKAEFDADEGFFLNDKSVKVRGMCNHQDFAGVGTAVPDRINRFRVEKLQSFGVNAWRMSHNPPNPELLDWADRLGMMVWDENRFFGDFSQWYTDLADMIRRDRNHPSIIWWSLCNEWGCQQFEEDVTVNIGLKFREIIKSLDLTRPISGAWNGDLTTGEIWGTKVCDIMGINYNYGSYDPFHQTLPTIPLVSSESCSCTSDRSYNIDESDAIIGPYNAWSCIRDCWMPVATRSFVMGSFDWTGFDYRGEESPTQWPAINSHFGVVDLSGFSKDDMYYSQAWFFPDQPIVHIVPQSWNLVPSDLYLLQCDPNYQWKFDASSKTGSTIESTSLPGLCIKGQPTFPATIARCNPNDPTFIFHMDNFNQIYYFDEKHNEMCLDVFAGTGPQVGFFACKNATGTNQNWMFNSANEIESSSMKGSCAVVGVQILVYTNGDEVELMLNGKSLGSQKIAAYDSGNYAILFEKGNLTAVVTKKGAKWGVDTIETTDEGVAIVLEVERPTGGEAIINDGQDVALLRASVVDSKGRLVRSATDTLTFMITSGDGRVVGTGNGNPSDHTPDHGNKRAVWNGFARAIIGTNMSSTFGKIVVQASATGLKSAEVTISTMPIPMDVNLI